MPGMPRFKVDTNTFDRLAHLIRNREYTVRGKINLDIKLTDFTPYVYQSGTPNQDSSCTKDGTKCFKMMNGYGYYQNSLIKSFEVYGDGKIETTNDSPFADLTGLNAQEYKQCILNELD